MKHLNTYENHNNSEIAHMLKKASDNNDIKIQTDVKKVMKHLNKFDIGSFESFVLQNPNNFVSVANQEQERVKQYIKRFKELGIDTSKLEKLNHGFLDQQIRLEDLIGEYNHSLSYYDNDEEDEKEMNDEIIRLEQEVDKLTPKVKEHKKELLRLKEQAYKILTN